ncbi:hypothetical protein [Peribacillus butanolivorans]|uniref:hypothetical protein n=1 Tax=Peribacillus butanolivorans TaxID=421767 RepID=UPI00382D7E74
MNKKRIFKRAIAMKLVEKGHRILKIEQNKRAFGFMVYVFEDTFGFQEDLHIVIKNCQR